MCLGTMLWIIGSNMATNARVLLVGSWTGNQYQIYKFRVREIWLIPLHNMNIVICFHVSIIKEI